jgi:kynureninase
VTVAEARELDARDELADFRALFYRRPEQVYLNGNSLGLLSRPAEAALLRVLEEWKTLGVSGWLGASPPWFFMAEDLAAQLAPLVGAEANEVIVANATTVNLHQLLATLFRPEGGRTKILIDALAFPSDRYAVASQLLLRGLDPGEHTVVVPARADTLLAEEDVLDAMSEEVHTAVLPSVVYTTGQLLDVATLAREAHRRGILVGIDCSHSIGALPHSLSEWGIDFAFWCNYKYLNNGPGGIGGLYLNRRHHGRSPGLAGWFSSDKERQFDMSPALQPARGAGAMQIGTPDVLSMAVLQGSLPVFAAADIERIRRKSLALTGYLMSLVEAVLGGHGFRIITPREDSRRGGHVAIAHPEALRICRALKEQVAIPDFRPPDVIRLAPVALYTSFEDCWEAVRRLKRIMEERLYEQYAEARELVP